MSLHYDLPSQREFWRMDEVADSIAVMQHQQETSYRRSDYLAADHSGCSKVLDGAWRQRTIEWMYNLVDHCALRRDSVAVATCYLDLCVERGVVDSRQHFQLCAMTALVLSIKLYDSTVVKLDSMIKLGRGLFRERDIIDMEVKILTALRWNVHPPTPICFLRQFLLLLPSSVSPAARYMITEVTRFVSEISVCLYKFIDCRADAISYAGMLIAMKRIDEVTLPNYQRQQICETMLATTGLDYSSPSIQEIGIQLQMSLEKNVNLQDLMTTIDAQCLADGVRQTSSPTPLVVSSPKYTTTTCAVGFNSPRDVLSTRQPRI